MVPAFCFTPTAVQPDQRISKMWGSARRRGPEVWVGAMWTNHCLVPTSFRLARLGMRPCGASCQQKCRMQSLICWNSSRGLPSTLSRTDSSSCLPNVHINASRPFFWRQCRRYRTAPNTTKPQYSPVSLDQSTSTCMTDRPWMHPWHRPCLSRPTLNERMMSVLDETGHKLTGGCLPRAMLRWFIEIFIVCGDAKICQVSETILGKNPVGPSSLERPRYGFPMLAGIRVESIL